MRTNYCGDLRKSDVGTAVHLFGWVQKRRDLGGLVFIDMRDRGGIVQVCFDPKNPERQKELPVSKMITRISANYLSYMSRIAHALGKPVQEDEDDSFEEEYG